uniref:Somatostatin receptor type 3-like n=1 Tax=Saccoglossus kowalevskii TaxID=10224 RepID=A0ABM0GN08_SACKO
MTSVPNLYMLNLACADFLFLLWLPFIAYFNTTKRWIFGSIMCKIVMGIDGVNTFTGIFTLTAMAINRYSAVVNLTWSKKGRSFQKTRTACFIIWLLAAIISMPLWLYSRTETFRGVTVCSVICNANTGKPQRRRRQFHVGRVSAMVIAAVVLFLVCWLPFWVVRILLLYRKHITNPSLCLQIAYYISVFTSATNSCLNPIVYAYFKHDFKNAIKAHKWTS